MFFWVLLFLSAFFSGSEVAFFSLNSNDLKNISSKFKFSYKIISFLLKYSSQLLITILICNTIVNVSIAIVAVYITIDIVNLTSANQVLSIFIEIVIVTLLILTFGEIGPKVLAKKNPVQFSRYTSLPIFIVFILIYPLSRLLEQMNIYLKNILKIKLHKGFTISPKLNQIIDIIDHLTSYDVNKKNFLKRINELLVLSAKDISIPRTRLHAVEINSNMDTVLTIFETINLSYLPVYENNLDNIIGIVSLNKILEIKKKDKKLNHKKIVDLIEKPLYVPEIKNVKDLLKEFKNSELPVAITIDEHGGVSGMITEDDILRIFFPTSQLSSNSKTEDLNIFQNTKKTL